MRHDPPPPLPGTTSPLERPRFLPAGTGALVVEFGAQVDESTSEAVLALDRAVAGAAIDGVIELVPTYRSLLVHFDPAVIRAAALRQKLEALVAHSGATPREDRLWTIPVCYGGACGEDLEAVAKLHKLDPEEVVAIHAASPFRVYMIGFAPGFAYLGGLDPRLHTSRRVEPRLRTPARSVSIGGAQSALNPPFELPSGWHLLGQTPVHLWDARREGSAEIGPSLLLPGDRVRLRPVEPEEYRDLCARAEAGDPVARLQTQPKATEETPA
ncbi:5-oxoprolinase subunit PxpB [Pararhodobacter sp.]|uniref:5-oxoprolinase subunit PxpB n=1 Tax=Pararhodobacter sp. TaxID=2127056 RepID=UPI002FE27C28|nr:5-oxoprolinase subunit PxpB [Pseudomonadota bacterium]